ncbi:MAG: two component transcriptional regulator, LuxR family [Modestobacter sp.]|jgi:DNA-binding NarL/FixJ family response regulator|nr:two component transcriptional regulator, LuxR family [Modestobacter sp.]
MTIRVLLADDQALLRTGFRMILQAQPDLDVVGEAVDGADAVRLARTLQPDVVLMDVRMPVLDGIQATAAITADGGATRVLILTTFDLDEYAFAGLRAGASGFLLKDVPPAELASAIRAVAAGDAVVSPRVTRQLLDRFSPHLPDPAADHGRPPDRHLLAALTDREREVFAEVARGRTNAEVAGRLHLSEATVKTHLTRVLSKLGLRDRVQIVVFAYEHGLVNGD